MTNIYQVVSDTNVGGAGRYLLNYVENFSRDKYNVTVIIPENSMLKPLLDKFSDITVIEAPYMSDKSYDRRCVKVLKKIFLDGHAHIVHSHASLSARIAARQAKVGKIIATRHCIESKGKFPLSVVKSFLNNLLCDIYVAVSDTVVDNLLDSGIKKEKIRAIANGVKPITIISNEEKAKLRNKLGIGDEIVFGMFARLEEIKGHKFFIEAAKQFINRGGKGKFLIVGDGSLLNELKAQAKDVSEVIFTGYVEDTTELLNITDVNVNASASEAMSLAILEAMSLGKPTIATNVGGNPQIVISEKNGILVEYGDPDGMAEAFFKLSDKDFYKSCAEYSSDLFESKYTSEIMVNNLEKLYEEVSNEN